eukprot:4014590-Pyramimonas_sp.AAC.1
MIYCARASRMPGFAQMSPMTGRIKWKYVEVSERQTNRSLWSIDRVETLAKAPQAMLPPPPPKHGRPISEVSDPADAPPKVKAKTAAGAVVAAPPQPKDASLAIPAPLPPPPQAAAAAEAALPQVQAAAEPKAPVKAP